MEPKYYTKEQDGIFYIYPPNGTDWVAASRDKKEAEEMCAEKNKKLQTETLHTAVFHTINGAPRECKLHIKEINFADVEEYEPQQEKPKKKRVPKVLRPTVTLPEKEWEIVCEELKKQAKHYMYRAGESCITAGAEYTLRRMRAANQLLRLAEYMRNQAKNYCESIRGVEDDESPF